MSYALSGRSKRELEGVHQRLKLLVTEAIKQTTTDFLVFEGVRTIQRQREYVERGVSHTMRSRHLTGHAVDLVSLVDNVPRWEMGPLFHVADAMRTVALQEDIPLRWGGCWDVLMTESSCVSADEMHFGYLRRSIAKGRRPFVDGAHFELPRTHYT